MPLLHIIPAPQNHTRELFHGGVTATRYRGYRYMRATKFRSTPDRSYRARTLFELHRCCLQTCPEILVCNSDGLQAH